MIAVAFLLSMSQVEPERAILLRAAEIVEQSWTQRAAARDCNGDYAPVYSTIACSWCATGAVAKAWFELGDAGNINWGQVRSKAFRLAHRRLNLRRSAQNIIGLAPWNDKPRRTAAQVAKMLREAAAL